VPTAKEYFMFFIISFFASLLTVPAFADVTPAKVALIDMQRAIHSVSDGKKARESLQKEWEDKQKKLQADGKKVQEKVEALRKQASVLDEKTRREREEGIQQEIMKLRETEMKAQTEFQGRDREVSGPIIQKIREFVANLSKEKGYTLVIDGNEGNVIFAQDTDDITEQVIKLYDGAKKK
jgi:outer membrane protein